METTSIKVHEFEKSKAASSRLAANRDKISSTFTSVVAGAGSTVGLLAAGCAGGAGSVGGVYRGRL